MLFVLLLLGLFSCCCCSFPGADNEVPVSDASGHCDAAGAAGGEGAHRPGRAGSLVCSAVRVVLCVDGVWMGWAGGGEKRREEKKHMHGCV